MSLFDDLSAVAEMKSNEKRNREVAAFKDTNHLFFAIRRETDPQGYTLLWNCGGKGIRTFFLQAPVKNSDTSLEAWQVCEMFRLIRDYYIANGPMNPLVDDFKNLKFPMWETA